MTKLKQLYNVWGKRKCNTLTGVVYFDCTAINDGYSKDCVNQKGIFGCGVIDKDTPDKYA